MRYVMGLLFAVVWVAVSLSADAADRYATCKITGGSAPEFKSWSGFAESLAAAKEKCDGYAATHGGGECSACRWADSKVAATYKCSGEVWCEKGDQFRAYDVKNRKEDADSAPEAADKVVWYVQEKKAPEGFTCRNYSLKCELQ